MASVAAPFLTPPVSYSTRRRPRAQGRRHHWPL